MQAANVFSTLAAVAVLAVPVLAQNNNNPPANNSPSPSSSAADSSEPSSSTAGKAPSTPSSAPPLPTPSTSSSVSKTPSSSPSPSSAIPRITGSGSSGAADSNPSGLPTLTPTNAIPTYPAPSVPPTKNAPFMQQSSAPDGTVFIAVGAILGAFGLGILLWRGIVSFLLHRSVRRAALAQHDTNAKTGFPAPPAPFYKYTDQSSPVGTPAGRGVRRNNRAPGVPSATPSQSNLFFSPTAVASSSGPGVRGSTFLPSGFYAAGSGSPGGQPGPSISLTNLRPDSMSHNNGSRLTLDPSPPDSPHFSGRRNMSSSSVNLNAHMPGQRAPSAYLEDLLADDPGSLPPPHMPPSSGPRHPSNYGGRY